MDWYRHLAPNNANLKVPFPIISFYLFIFYIVRPLIFYSSKLEISRVLLDLCFPLLLHSVYNQIPVVSLFFMPFLSPPVTCPPLKDTSPYLFIWIVLITCWLTLGSVTVGCKLKLLGGLSGDVQKGRENYRAPVINETSREWLFSRQCHQDTLILLQEHSRGFHYLVIQRMTREEEFRANYFSWFSFFCTCR